MMDMHIHSTFSDGQDSPEAIVETAIQLGYKHVGICDHVRIGTLWFPEYFHEIQRLKKKYINHINIYSAIESKVIDFNGNIDAQPSFFVVDIVYAAVHRIPLGDGQFCTGNECKDFLKNNWLKSLLAACYNPNVHVIAHPFMPALQYNIELKEDEILNLADHFVRTKKKVEINIKYPHPMNEVLLKRMKLRSVILGSDSHSIFEMREKYNHIINNWRKLTSMVDVDFMPNY